MMRIIAQAIAAGALALGRFPSAQQQERLTLSVPPAGQCPNTRSGHGGAIKPAPIEPGDGLRDENTNWREWLVCSRCGSR
jgi:hypothetical protein